MRATPPYAIPNDAKVYVAGHRGLVGGAITRALEARGLPVLGRASSQLDLRDRDAVDAFFDAERPTHVVLTAAKVGGILANSTYPADFLSDNLRIQVNVLDAAARTGVDRLIFLGSSCIYPKLAEQPIREDSLLTGALEPTNDAYAIAKIAGILQIQALRRQHGVSFISAMPTNLYGPGDNFDLAASHVPVGVSVADSVGTGVALGLAGKAVSAGAAVLTSACGTPDPCFTVYTAPTTTRTASRSSSASLRCRRGRCMGLRYVDMRLQRRTTSRFRSTGRGPDGNGTRPTCARAPPHGRSSAPSPGPPAPG